MRWLQPLDLAFIVQKSVSARWAGIPSCRYRRDRRAVSLVLGLRHFRLRHKRNNLCKGQHRFRTSIGSSPEFGAHSHSSWETGQHDATAHTCFRPNFETPKVWGPMMLPSVKLYLRRKTIAANTTRRRSKSDLCVSYDIYANVVTDPIVTSSCSDQVRDQNTPSCDLFRIHKHFRTGGTRSRSAMSAEPIAECDPRESKSSPKRNTASNHKHLLKARTHTRARSIPLRIVFAGNISRAKSRHRHFTQSHPNLSLPTHRHAPCVNRSS